jgi:nitronate monooxygenase
MSKIIERVNAFCSHLGTQVPIMLAPLAGVPAPGLSVAVANAGGFGACGVLFMKVDEIAAWVETVRAGSNGLFQLNTWIPDPTPKRDRNHEARIREFLGKWGPEVQPEAGDAAPPSFEEQCEAMLAARPPAVSSVMGLFPSNFVAQLKQRNILWLATISTVAEAKAAEVAGADIIVAQGAEAGGHRGCFVADNAEREQTGLFALLPAVVDAVSLPAVAAGGIADGRGIAAALMLGASAVQIGTGFLRCPEAEIHPAWAAALAKAMPEDTCLTRAFSGRAGRSLVTGYVRATVSPDAPHPAPYPVQRGLTAGMRRQAQDEGDIQRMQAWAGQSARLARAEPAGDVVRSLWQEAYALLRGV